MIFELVNGKDQEIDTSKILFLHFNNKGLVVLNLKATWFVVKGTMTTVANEIIKDLNS